MMRQAWWIACWKPYSQELHSETAGRERQDPEVSLISQTYIYTQPKMHKSEKKKPVKLGKMFWLMFKNHSVLYLTCQLDPYLMGFVFKSWVNRIHPLLALCTVIYSHCTKCTWVLFPHMLSSNRIFWLSTLQQLFNLWIPVRDLFSSGSLKQICPWMTNKEETHMNLSWNVKNFE